MLGDRLFVAVLAVLAICVSLLYGILCSPSLSRLEEPKLTHLLLSGEESAAVETTDSREEEPKVTPEESSGEAPAAPLQPPGKQHPHRGPAPQPQR